MEYFKLKNCDGMAQFIKKSLSSVVADEVAKEFSWLGFGSNMKVKGLHIVKILKLAAVSKFTDISEESVECQIKKYFHAIKDKLYHKNIKNNKCFFKFKLFIIVCIQKTKIVNIS